MFWSKVIPHICKCSLNTPSHIHVQVTMCMSTYTVQWRGLEAAVLPGYLHLFNTVLIQITIIRDIVCHHQVSHEWNIFFLAFLQLTFAIVIADNGKVVQLRLWGWLKISIIAALKEPCEVVDHLWCYRAAKTWEKIAREHRCTQWRFKNTNTKKFA